MFIGFFLRNLVIYLLLYRYGSCCKKNFINSKLLSIKRLFLKIFLYRSSFKINKKTFARFSFLFSQIETKEHKDRNLCTMSLRSKIVYGLSISI